MAADRHITIETRRLIGRLWLVKLAEVGNGGNKYLPWISNGDPTVHVARRLGRALR
jgi:hypothetical protein